MVYLAFAILDRKAVNKIESEIENCDISVHSKGKGNLISTESTVDLVVLLLRFWKFRPEIWHFNFPPVWIYLQYFMTDDVERQVLMQSELK